MANHQSALKRARQSEKRRIRNKSVRTNLRRTIRTVRQAVEAGDAAVAQQALQAAIPVIDKAASKGVIHRNNASRKISRLAMKVNALNA
ncbi:ribosomal protein S20 [Desulfarculus baarsii DSM 2075]|uniref:Small ribosomal subunit protein bS20 n=1 Tax=Desulfarculus baarsii (strain ATCC 33931 / DSM 2075 / LMG 7858 / VKM B-1802 / 2st14) TaxID=644282 RepID=E1QGU0_DESB2|nr:30S ribosomal protein S20 [Desulfarculus baarsii]ADK84783.1 ribosomal protein S20 [Desulfarculus baarsii DSM 2075]